MKIEIDTKEDLHNIKHIMRLLHAISVNAGGKFKPSFDDDMFSENSSPSPSSVPETSPSLFNMFDSGSSSSSTTESSPDPYGVPDIFQEKKNNDKKDFIDSLQVY